MPKFTKVDKKTAGKPERAEKAIGTRSALISKLQYRTPPLDLLDKRDSAPMAGDIEQNSAIIKRTLENFGIPVEMSPDIIVGPAVTQYALKPAEGVKLSKITTLSMICRFRLPVLRFVSRHRFPVRLWWELKCPTREGQA